jgi:hypothetical protein
VNVNDITQASDEGVSISNLKLTYNGNNSDIVTYDNATLECTITEKTKDNEYSKSVTVKYDGLVWNNGVAELSNVLKLMDMDDVNDALHTTNNKGNQTVKDLLFNVQFTVKLQNNTNNFFTVNGKDLFLAGIKQDLHVAEKLKNVTVTSTHISSNKITVNLSYDGNTAAANEDGVKSGFGSYLTYYDASNIEVSLDPMDGESTSTSTVNTANNTIKFVHINDKLQEGKQYDFNMHVSNNSGTSDISPKKIRVTPVISQPEAAEPISFVSIVRDSSNNFTGSNFTVTVPQANTDLSTNNFSELQLVVKVGNAEKVYDISSGLWPNMQTDSSTFDIFVDKNESLYNNLKNYYGGQFTAKFYTIGKYSEALKLNPLYASGSKKSIEISKTFYMDSPTVTNKFMELTHVNFVSGEQEYVAIYEGDVSNVSQFSFDLSGSGAVQSFIVTSPVSVNPVDVSNLVILDASKNYVKGTIKPTFEALNSLGGLVNVTSNIAMNESNGGSYDRSGVAVGSYKLYPLKEPSADLDGLVSITYPSITSGSVVDGSVNAVLDISGSVNAYLNSIVNTIDASNVYFDGELYENGVSKRNKRVRIWNNRSNNQVSLAIENSFNSGIKYRAEYNVSLDMDAVINNASSYNKYKSFNQDEQYLSKLGGSSNLEFSFTSPPIDTQITARPKLWTDEKLNQLRVTGDLAGNDLDRMLLVVGAKDENNNYSIETQESTYSAEAKDSNNNWINSVDNVPAKYVLDIDVAGNKYVSDTDTLMFGVVDINTNNDGYVISKELDASAQAFNTAVSNLRANDAANNLLEAKITNLKTLEQPQNPPIDLSNVFPVLYSYDVSLIDLSGVINNNTRPTKEQALNDASNNWVTSRKNLYEKLEEREAILKTRYHISNLFATITTAFIGVTDGNALKEKYLAVKDLSYALIAARNTLDRPASLYKYDPSYVSTSSTLGLADTAEAAVGNNPEGEKTLTNANLMKYLTTQKQTMMDSYNSLYATLNSSSLVNYYDVANNLNYATEASLKDVKFDKFSLYEDPLQDSYTERTLSVAANELHLYFRGINQLNSSVAVTNNSTVVLNYNKHLRFVTAETELANLSQNIIDGSNAYYKILNQDRPAKYNSNLSSLLSQRNTRYDLEWKLYEAKLPYFDVSNVDGGDYSVVGKDTNGNWDPSGNTIEFNVSVKY